MEAMDCLCCLVRVFCACALCAELLVSVGRCVSCVCLRVYHDIFARIIVKSCGRSSAVARPYGSAASATRGFVVARVGRDVLIEGLLLLQCEELVQAGSSSR